MELLRSWLKRLVTFRSQLTNLTLLAPPDQTRPDRTGDTPLSAQLDRLTNERKAITYSGRYTISKNGYDINDCNQKKENQINGQPASQAHRQTHITHGLYGI